MKRLIVYATIMQIVLIATLFESAYSWSIFELFDWDLILKDNRIDPVWFRKYFGFAPKKNNTIDSVYVDVKDKFMVECLRKCVKEDPT